MNPDNDIKEIPVNLFAPPEFWKLTSKQRNKITNGCGPGNWRVDFVPDVLFGLPIHTCCDIHDYMYSVGNTIEDKKSADRTFLNNMLRMIDSAPDHSQEKYIERKIAAYAYYEAVVKFGGPAFWQGKNKPEEECIVLESYFGRI